MPGVGIEPTRIGTMIYAVWTSLHWPGVTGYGWIRSERCGRNSFGFWPCETDESKPPWSSVVSTMLVRHRLSMTHQHGARRRDEFVFRRLDTIGDVDAAQDAFLNECFIDTGILDVLADCEDSRRLVVGRTGSGKTAILKRLAQQNSTVIVIEPERLALPYISNTTILKFVADLGVDLDIFFRYLWRHVLSVELLREHYSIRTEEQKTGFLERIRSAFRSSRHSKAIGYIERFGREFWKDTDVHIKDVTRRLSENIETTLKASHLPIEFGYVDGGKLSEEQRSEITARAQIIVSDLQMRELSEMLEFLDDVLDDPQQRYYLVVDGLDENWVDERTRYALVRGLIETVRDFRKVRHAKVIVAMRQDLIERVFQKTRDSGFQEEKYESLYLNLRWSPEQLIQLLDSRIDRLVRHRYTRRQVTHVDVLPERIGKRQTVDYMLDRTMLRPRDVILFFNQCIERAADKPRISVQMVRDAEGEYSRLRLRSLFQEWHSDYPNMNACVQLLKNRPPVFGIVDIEPSSVTELCLRFEISEPTRQDVISTSMHTVFEGGMSPEEFVKEAVEMFYRVGLVGLKLSSGDSTAWSIHGRRSISSAEITAETRVSIHPCFWRVLGTLAGSQDD